MMLGLVVALVAIESVTTVADGQPLPDLIGEISEVSTEFDATVVPGDVTEACWPIDSSAMKTQRSHARAVTAACLSLPKTSSALEFLTYLVVG